MVEVVVASVSRRRSLETLANSTSLLVDLRVFEAALFHVANLLEALRASIGSSVHSAQHPLIYRWRCSLELHPCYRHVCDHHVLVLLLPILHPLSRLASRLRPQFFRVCPTPTFCGSKICPRLASALGFSALVGPLRRVVVKPTQQNTTPHSRPQTRCLPDKTESSTTRLRNPTNKTRTLLAKPNLCPNVQPFQATTLRSLFTVRTHRQSTTLRHHHHHRHNRTASRSSSLAFILELDLLQSTPFNY